MGLAGFKADAVLGAQLILRHRAPRMALILGVALLSAATRAPADFQARMLLGVLGSLAAVGASRVWAPGAALGAVAVASTPLAVQLAGRGLGFAMVAALVVAGAVALVLPSPDLPAVWLLAAGVGLVGCGVMALSPWVGASAAAILGALVAWWWGGPVGNRLPQPGFWSVAAVGAVVLALYASLLLRIRLLRRGAT